MNTEISDDGLDPTLLLKGMFPLPKFIRFVRERCPPGRFDEAALVEDWRTARAEVLRLQREEGDEADAIGIHALPEEMLPLDEQALRQPSMHRMTSVLPRRWQMVEIDRLVVFQ